MAESPRPDALRTDSLRDESIAVVLGRPDAPGEPLNVPIVGASTYRHESDENRYARSSVTSTVAAFEQLVAGLERARHALAFGSGMAAISAVIEGLPDGAVAVVPHAAYSGTVSIFAREAELGRLTLRPVEVADTAAVCTALAGADLVWLETIGNPLLAVPDLPAIIASARADDTLVCVDATFSTPLGCRPLEFGADLVVHSATKYLAGHSDVLLGVVLTDDDALAARLHDRRTAGGALPGALEAYLGTRGIRTLALRMERAQANALELATRLAGHPRVTRVRYPGLADDPAHALATRDYTGFGAVVAFEVDGGGDGGIAAAERVCAAVRLIVHATSLGGVETLIERRARYAVDAACGTPPGLLRLAVGIEHVEDLWADLAHALDA